MIYIFLFIFIHIISHASSISQDKQELSLYREFYNEGEKFTKFCNHSEHIPLYKNKKNALRLKKIYLSTLQYTGLYVATQALAIYVEKLNFSKIEYRQLTRGLIDNFCSPNISVISLEELEGRMLSLYKKKSSYQLPSFKNNHLFPSPHLLGNKNTENEFLFTVQLFRNLCSWGNDPNELRLLVPFVKNPMIIARIARQLSMKKIAWDESSQSILLKDEPRTLKVDCHNLSCRPSLEPIQSKGEGSDSIYEDGKRIYCLKFKDARYKKNSQPKKILSMIRKSSPLKDELLATQLIALLTGFQNITWNVSEVLRESMDKIWSGWVEKKLKQKWKDLHYEEDLQVRLILGSAEEQKNNRSFHIELKVFKGEIDREYLGAKELKLEFQIKLSLQFLSWLKKELRDETKNLKNLRALLRTRVHQKILQKKLSLPFWRQSAEELIVDEVLRLLKEKRSDLFSRDQNGVNEIKVTMYFGYFSLKYLSDDYKIKKKLEI